MGISEPEEAPGERHVIFSIAFPKWRGTGGRIRKVEVAKYFKET
jgi:hypothetical protein